MLLKSNQELPIGSKAPDFSLKSIDGKIYSLSDFKSKALLIIFICNHCPYVLPKIPTMKKLKEKYKDKLIIVAINPNNNPNYPEDSFDNMKRYFQEWNFDFYYLLDETQEVARNYHASCTPDPFLFNQDKILVYHGRFDPAHGEEGAGEDIDLAIKSILENKEIKQPFKPSMGCSIKWVR